MLDAPQAKSLFRTNLSLMLLTVFWPLIAVLVALTAAVASFDGIGYLVALLSLIWLGLLVYIIVRFWRSAPEVGVTPWASLWILVPFSGVFFVSMLFLEPLKYIADAKPQDRRLPLTWPLIKESVAFFFKNFRILLKTSIWLLYISLTLGISTVITLQWPLFAIVQLLLYVAVIFLSLWLSMKLFAEIATLESGGSLTGQEGAEAKKNIWSYLWVTILMMLVVLAPLLITVVLTLVGIFAAGSASEMVRGLLNAESSGLGLGAVVGIFIGGSILAIMLIFSYIWIIYKSNQFAFTLGSFILEGKRSMEALKESTRLVKGRWWGTFWKNQLMGMTVGLVAVIIMQALLGTLLAVIAIAAPKGLVGQTISTLLATGVQGAMQMVLIPLLLSFQVKLYRAFKRTANN